LSARSYRKSISTQYFRSPEEAGKVNEENGKLQIQKKKKKKRNSKNNVL